MTGAKGIFIAVEGIDAVGKRTLWAGEAGAGSRLKLVTNSWVLAVVETAAETMAS